MKVSLPVVLQRLKKNEIVNELCNLDCVKEKGLQLNSCAQGVRNKLEIIRTIRKKLESLERQHEGLLDDVTAELDLIFHMKHNNKQWTLFKFTYPKGRNGRSVGVDPHALQQSLIRNLSIGFEVHCIYKLEEELVWLRIALCDQSYRPKKYAVMYAVHQLHSSFVVTTQLAPAMRKAIFSVFTQAFRFLNAKGSQLTGKCPRSLIEIGEETPGSGNSRAIEELRSTSTKRTAQEIDNDVPHLIDHQKAIKRLRRDYANATFGTEEQPLLQRLECTFDTDFSGYPEGSNHERLPFHCRITFEGPSVLEELKEMVYTGAASYPLPECLTSIKSAKRNAWKITNSNS